MRGRKLRKWGERRKKEECRGEGERRCERVTLMKMADLGCSLPLLYLEILPSISASSIYSLGTMRLLFPQIFFFFPGRQKKLQMWSCWLKSCPLILLTPPKRQFLVICFFSKIFCDQLESSSQQTFAECSFWARQGWCCWYKADQHPSSPCPQRAYKAWAPGTHTWSRWRVISRILCARGILCRSPRRTWVELKLFRSTGVRPQTESHWLVKRLENSTLNLDLSGPGRGWKYDTQDPDTQSLAECLDLTVSGEDLSSSVFGIMSQRCTLMSFYVIKRGVVCKSRNRL